ncbi:hypothetical protein O181_099980 [Austropuccinia psidii MF-1]|uniref:Uncharacterized protein n=1 Tax=Austropuccinia psidii MF-1 TaxID=1389203 RepID=A0A9Q3JBW5_9BASI|nr:hypothetical protein [Austropuccinia psidii MF-1]
MLFQRAQLITSTAFLACTFISFVLTLSTQECRRKYQPLSDKPDETTVICVNHGNYTYNCAKKTCRVGDKHTPLSPIKNPYDALRFRGCYQGTSRFGFIYPDQYTSDPNTDEIDVGKAHSLSHSAPPQPIPFEGTFKCWWNGGRLKMNYKRYVCGECVLIATG